MDRPTVYPGALPRSADFLALGQDAMVGLAKLTEAAFGTATVVDGFTLTPTAPASLQAVLSGGSIYEQENLEATQWSSLPSDSHTIVKQGIARDPQNVTFAAPTTVGYAQCFLVEASYLDSDAGSLVLPYYNAANPSVPYSGPGNAGTANNTVRKGAVSVQVKAGIAAPSGTQVVPTPDAGWVGLYVVTLAQGATTVTAGNIATYSGAPFILAKLPAVPGAVQAGQWTYAGLTTNSGNVFTANLLPAPATFPVGMKMRAQMNAAPTGAATFVLNGQTFAIQRRAGAACVGAEWAPNDVVDFNVLSSSILQIDGLTPPDVSGSTSSYVANYVTNNYAKGSYIGTQVFSTAGTYTYTPSPGTHRIVVTVVGGGGAGTGLAATDASHYGAGGGGAGGGFAISELTSGFSGQTITVGAGGIGAANNAVAQSGGTSSFGAFVSATGGQGGTAAAATSTSNAFTISGGNGGSGIGGTDVNGVGSSGGVATGFSTGDVLSGYGGASYLGYGAGGRATSTGPGLNAVSPGSGGGGALNQNSASANAGGNGAPGQVMIEEYA